MMRNDEIKKPSDPRRSQVTRVGHTPRSVPAAGIDVTKYEPTNNGKTDTVNTSTVTAQIFPQFV